MTEEDVDYFAEPDGLDDLDVIGSSGGSEAEARLAGGGGVAGLDKITAEMSGGEHRPEQQEMCRAVAEAMVTRAHLVVQAGTEVPPSGTWGRVDNSISDVDTS
jgi:hypothetical protein